MIYRENGASSELAAGFQNSLTGGSSGESQTVARGNLDPEVAADVLRTRCQTAPVAVLKCWTLTATAASQRVLRTGSKLAVKVTTALLFTFTLHFLLNHSLEFVIIMQEIL